MLAYKLVGKWVKVGICLGFGYDEPNGGSWLAFELTEFADVGVFGLEEDEEFGI